MVKVLIEREDGNYTYKFPVIDSIMMGKESPATAFSFVEVESPEVIKVEGVYYTLSVSWRIMDVDTDTSEGTNTTPVRTAQEQVEYLMDKFVTAKLNEQAFVVFDEPGWSWNDKTTTIFKGVVTKLQLTVTGGVPARYEGTMEFVIGSNVLRE